MTVPVFVSLIKSCVDERTPVGLMVNAKATLSDASSWINNFILVVWYKKNRLKNVIFSIVLMVGIQPPIKPSKSKNR